MDQLLHDEWITKSKRSVACGTGFVLTGGTHSLLNSVAYWQGEHRQQCIKGIPSISIQRCLQLRQLHRILDNDCPHAGKDYVANLAAQGLRQLSDPATQLGVSVRSSCCNQSKHLKRRQVYSDSYTQLTVSEGLAHHWLKGRTYWDRGTKSKSKEKTRSGQGKKCPLYTHPPWPLPPAKALFSMSTHSQ